ncbi:MAG TPA: four helix bundle protein, partial [Chitinophagaceae bacterium]|nr:four helix bundle protein [Chitinophagaceae bacterium]
MHKFQSLKVWQRSMELAANIYIVTKEFPIDERFGLVSQLRKCSVSIPSNIAEGSGRNTNKQFQYFL